MNKDRIENVLKWLSFESYDSGSEIIHTLSVYTESNRVTCDMKIDDVNTVELFRVVYEYITHGINEEEFFVRLLACN